MRPEDSDTRRAVATCSRQAEQLWRSFKKALAVWLRRSEGASAVEFALIAPMIVLGLVTMVDLGLAMNERMTIDHVLRSGAQQAIADPGESAVLGVLNATAAKNFTLPQSNPPPPYTLGLSVSRFCACPDSTEAVVACSTICSGPVPTFIYYRLSGQKAYKGMIIPAITSSLSVQVQIR